MAAARRLLCGIDMCSCTDISNSLASATQSGFDYIACPIVHPRFRREFRSGKAKGRAGAFTRSDMLLTSHDWSTLVVGKLSPYLDVDSDVEAIRKNSEEALEQELIYASHLGLPAIKFSLKSKKCVNLARHIHNRVVAGVSYQVWVQVPMHAPKDLSKLWLNNKDAGGEGLQLADESYTYKEDTWEWWNVFRSVGNFEKKLGLALEMTADLPPEDEIKRWLGEPVLCLILPTSVFLTNKKGFPVLSRSHQLVVKEFYKMNVQLMITGSNRHNHIKLYQQCLEFLWTLFDKNQSPEDTLSNFARGYEDYLQCPLQPLMDNLESQTYEIFEKDPVKYSEYQRAMYQAILERVSDEDKDSTTIVLMVVGAGRGPLVRAALSAASRADRKVKVYAVEKNPNAVVTLFTQQDEMWGEDVTVVSCDMREFEPEEKADILVSELLGSFGDNELSPECLDGAQKFLKDDGISIPESYTSFLSPLQSSRLYNEVRLSKERDKHPLSSFETPYVVRLHNRMELAQPQALFSFHHPNRDPVRDNRRYQCLNFHILQDSVLHGFSGYFETVLYKDIKLSIVPETHSPGMFSWFPIMFPVKDPVPLPKGCEVEVHFWRCSNRRNVWYEWLITKPQVIPIHNPNGRSYTIGL